MVSLLPLCVSDALLTCIVLQGSDVLHLNILGQSIVILNSVKAAVNLLDKRGTIYSDRPPFTYFEL